MRVFLYECISVVCYTENNFDIAVVFKDKTELSKSKIRENINERDTYQYKSVLLDALYNSLKIRENFLITNYKDKSKTTRITKKKRNEIIECDKEMMTLTKAYDYFKRI